MIRILSKPTRAVQRTYLCSRMMASTHIKAPALTYISGEEMSRWAGELYLQEWIKPYIDTSKWEFFDLSCKSRDNTDDKVLADCINSGKRIGAIYKEPTITPTADQVKEFGLKKAWGSPNGAMRKGWNGISISRDTIHLPGMKLGYKKPVFFDRHAVGGEYGASFKTVGPGTLTTTFNGEVLNERKLTDKVSAVVVYDNPYDNVVPMAHHFFKRCLDAKITPYVCSKKTVFKWQETFWQTMKNVFDEHYKADYTKAGLLENCGGELTHYLSDVASMQIIRWSDGGWGMCAHNYDGDLLTDELAFVHRSPGFLTSVLNGVNDDGSIIKEFEASHGTVTDMWHAHNRGEETSLNPLSMMEALIGAMIHSAVLGKERYPTSDNDQLIAFSKKLQTAIHEQMTSEMGGTRDLCGPNGLTTPQFVAAVRARLDAALAGKNVPASVATKFNDPYQVDKEMVRRLFDDIDTDKSGRINFEEFFAGMARLGLLPKKLK